jgi:hypothetical protein
VSRTPGPRTRRQLAAATKHKPNPTRSPDHHTPLTSAVVVTEMATAPRRGSSEGASPTASVTALLRVPGGAEVSGFGVRERLITLTVFLPVQYCNVR